MGSKKNTSIKEFLFSDVVCSEESEIAIKFNDFFLVVLLEMCTEM